MRTPLAHRRLVLAVPIAAVGFLLAGCTGGTVTATGSTSPASTSASTSASTEPTSSAPSTPSTSSSPSESASPTPSESPSPAPSTPEPTTTTLRSSRCTSAHLSASIAPGGGGAAGSVLPYLVLTNTGTQRCTLQGWPGVSFVGDGNGTQLGAAGDFDRASPHGTVTLDPGGAAHAPLKISNALNYDASTCNPVTADGLRVYPPGETHSLFAPSTDLTACRSDSVHLITVQALLPGAS